jgi:hypothetical protein
MRCFERQPGESSRAFEVYKFYRDLGPGRFIDLAYRISTGHQEGPKRAPGRWKSWAREHDWVGRVQAMEDHHEMIRCEALEQHEQRRATYLAARVEALREQNFLNEERAAALTTKFLDRAEQLLDELPLVRHTTVREGENGKPAICKVEPASKNAIADIERLHRIATRNEPTKVDTRTYDFESMSDQELERIAAGEDPARVLRCRKGGA